MNVTGNYAENSGEIKALMAQQLCSPVKWYDTICKLIADRVEYFVEVGPGRVLAGLLKKILPKDYPCKIYNISSLRRLEQFFKEIS
jgi:[acyl-carrier-protein] S-malonyltransferase